MTQLKAESFITTSTTAADFGSQSFIPPAFQPGFIPAAIGAAFSDGVYAGTVPGIAGQPDRHLFLLAGSITNASWEDAAAFAAGLGGALPTRDEMPLLAKVDGRFLRGPYWTADRMNGDRAMAYSFATGKDGYSHTSNDFSGLVVRRIPVEAAGAEHAAPRGADVVGVAAGSVAESLLDAELWPEDGEIVAEIRAMFMHNWGMDGAQADARMSRFDFKAALAGVAALEGGAA